MAQNYFRWKRKYLFQILVNSLSSYIFRLHPHTILMYVIYVKKQQHLNHKWLETFKCMKDYIAAKGGKNHKYLIIKSNNY